MEASPPVALSVVIPVFNEQENLEPLITELAGALKALDRPSEIVCVDDCSTDRGFGVLKHLGQSQPALRVIRHRLQCGQSAALATGIRAARGEIIVTMDGDLQHDPADLPRLVGALEPGLAAVCGIRARRRDNWIRRASSRIANFYFYLLLGDRVADTGCTFRAIRREALAEVPRFNGFHRYLPTMLRFQGFKVLDIPVNHRPRVRGVSKYGIGNRLWRGILDCLAMRWYRARCLRGSRVGVE